MNKRPKISVVMPFYNAEKFLEDAIKSILNQTFIDFEFIIINDASTDNSDKIVKRYLKQDNRIIYIKNEKNRGIVYNLNKAIELARGEYIARMDGDDISMLDRFEKQVKFLDENKDISIVGGNVILINEEGKEIGKVIKPRFNEDILKFAFLGSPFVHPSVMIRKEVFTISKYNDKYFFGQDYYLWLELLSNGIKGYNIQDFLLKYRKHSNSTNTKNKKLALITFSLRKDYIKKYGYNGLIKIGLLGYIGMYIHFLLGYLLSGLFKDKIDFLFKKFLTGIKN